MTDRKRPYLAEQDGDDVLRRWRDDFEQLKSEIQGIEHRREIHDELIAEIERRGQEVEGAGNFAQYLDQTYDVAQLVAIRRLVDPDQRSVSLVSLLEEMAQRSDLLTREAHVQHWRDAYQEDEALVQLGDGEFSEICGSDEAAAVPASVLYDYQDSLRQALGLAKKFTDKRVAHNSRTEIGMTREQLNAAIDSLEFHMNKVGVLLVGSSSRAKPTMQYDWTAVFRSGLFSSDSDT